jgi:MraZ protein
MDQMEAYVEQMDAFDLFSSEHEDLATILFADSEQLSFDGEGRIMLPGHLLNHAGIGERAIFAGKGKKFQIWEPSAFEAERQKARQRAREQGLTLPQQRGGPRQANA